MSFNYLLIKDHFTREITYINYKKENGFKFNPKNKEGNITVNEMVVLKPTFVEKVLRRKIKSKLELYLEYIIRLLESDDDDITGLRSALNDLTRYRDIVRFQYSKYLDERYLELLLQKIDILERELKAQIINYRDIFMEKEENEKSR